MNNLSHQIDLFIESFFNYDGGHSLAFINQSLSSNFKKTLQGLYSKKLFSKMEFLQMAEKFLNFPNEYQILVKMLIEINLEIQDNEYFIKNLSQVDIIQGIANFLEKQNIELKYNQRWNEKHANGNEFYLETERQNTYSSTVGIVFQEILNLYYESAMCNNCNEINLNSTDEIRFSRLIELIGRRINLLDQIEKIIFFGYELELVDEHSVKIINSLNSREGSAEIDFINVLKSKFLNLDFDKSAELNYLKHSFENVNKPYPSDYFKYLPNKNNENELKNFAHAFQLDIKCEYNVERELVLFKEKYFPGIDNLEEIQLDNGINLNLKNTFRICSFIAEWSKDVNNNISNDYTTAIQDYSRKNKQSEQFDELERLTVLYKGNPDKLNAILKEHYSEDIYKEQQKIIEYAKGKIENEKCLIKVNLEYFVKVIQWVTQFEETFILKVLNLFKYENNSSVNVSNAPFFIIDKHLYWLPNMVAFNSFAEKLIENLVGKDIISVHRLQTKYFEKNLMNIFQKFNYKVIEVEKNKIIKDEHGKDKGDFDVLVYKDGNLIHMELKLTNSRNSYFERYKWKKSLDIASNQLSFGKKYIENNIDKIKNILNLNDNDKINKIESFIISNSYLFDHESINGFTKISYWEIMYALSVFESNKDKFKDLSFSTLLRKNIVFSDFKNLVFSYADTKLKIGNNALYHSSLIHQNLFTSIKKDI
jgi:Zn finger protein HypA/HybF involved in hydrogenase expression